MILGKTTSESFPLFAPIDPIDLLSTLNIHLPLISGTKFWLHVPLSPTLMRLDDFTLSCSHDD